MLTDISQLPDLTGKVALITGGNAGLGFETARALYLKNCRVVITGRNVDRLEGAIKRLKELKGNGMTAPDPVYLVGDQSSLKSVMNMILEFKDLKLNLDILVCNAGGVSPIGSPALTEEGLNFTMVTNHLSHFLIVDKLLDLLLKSSDPRIVIVSSLASRFVFSVDYKTINSKVSFEAYAISKLLNCFHASSLSDKLRDTPVHCNASQPGASFTDALKNNKHRTGNPTILDRIFLFLVWLFFTDPRISVLSQLYPAASLEIVEQDTRDAFIGPQIPSVGGWYHPSQTVIGSKSWLVNKKNKEECWKWSVEQIESVLPEWRPHSLLK